MNYTPSVEETKDAEAPIADLNTKKIENVANTTKESVSASKNTRSADKRIKADNPAASKDSNLSGTYRATAILNMRHGAGLTEKVLAIIPKNATVRNYGFYTEVDDVKWLYVQVVLNNIMYSGFCSSEYLDKI